MSKANNFWHDIAADRSMSEKLENFLKEADIKSPEDEIEAVARFAQGIGYAVDEEELALAKAQMRTISESEDWLEDINGGKWDDVDPDLYKYCAADYLCAAMWNTCAVSNECEDSLWTCKTAVSYGNCRNAIDATESCDAIFLYVPY